METITTTLKRHWQLNDAWNEIISPRFKRLNELTGTNLFGDYREINGHQVFINTVPEETNNNFDSKRIDHRHHALDALVIALTSENHVQYLNNISSQNENEEQKLNTRKGIKYQLTNTRKGANEEKEWYFLPPAQLKTASGIIEYEYLFGETKSKVFKEIAQNALEISVVSFKQKNKVIRQRWNKYLKPADGKITLVQQEGLKQSSSYNVRKRLHEDTYYGKVKLQNNKRTNNNVIRIGLKKALEDGFDFYNSKFQTLVNNLRNENLPNNEIIEKLEKENPTALVYEKFVATRFGNNLESFAQIPSNKIIKAIESVSATSIQRILLNHLENYDTIIKKIEEINEYVEFIVEDDHKRILKDLFITDSKVEFITIEKKEIRETEIFIKNLDEQIDKNLIKHNPQLAFSFDGIKELNKNIIRLNYGKFHQPIYKVRTIDAMGTKFSVSKDGQKSSKYVVTAAGSNAFCGFYQKGNERKFYIPTLRETVENLKQGFEPCPAFHPDDNEFKLIFFLNPSDLVYVPTKEEIESPKLVDSTNLNKEQINRIYKFTDGSGTTMNFVPSNIASLLFNASNKEQEKAGIKLPIQNELGLGSPQSKNQNSFNNVKIKAECWKLKVDRLGNIVAFIL